MLNAVPKPLSGKRPTFKGQIKGRLKSLPKYPSLGDHGRIISQVTAQRVNGPVAAVNNINRIVEPTTGTTAAIKDQIATPVDPVRSRQIKPALVFDEPVVATNSLATKELNAILKPLSGKWSIFKRHQSVSNLGKTIPMVGQL
jgi:hypothetical protein